MSVSVLTLVRGRDEHLRRLVTFLGRQRRVPDELVIASMQSCAPDLPETNVPVRVVPVAGRELPLAAARNAAAAEASGDVLLFLDVDCLPSPGLVAAYEAHLASHDHCAMGEVRYLPYLDDLDALDFESMAAVAVKHPARPAMPSSGWRVEPDAGSLWGLSFGMRRSRFGSAGGFDERFFGYGAEETDFAAALDACGTTFAWIADALSVHQHHAMHHPPLHHFASIVRNATLYRRKWGRWCMEYWLAKFHDMGLLEFRNDRDAVDVRRFPTTAEIAASRLDSTHAYA